MMAWDMTFAELGSFFGEGFLQVFGSPILIGLFLTMVIFWWTKDLKITIQTMLLTGTIGLITLSSSGYLPAWVGFLTLVVVATFAGVVVMTWLT